MAIPLIERAEQFSLEDLSKINLNRSQRNNSNLIKEHLSSNFDHPRVLLSPKGVGKTLVSRVSSNEVIRENENSLPVMLVYKQNNKSEILDYRKLATPEQWGERRLDIVQNCSREELLKKSTDVFFDDYHWRFEDIAKGRGNPVSFVNDIRDVLNEAKRGKHTVFLSESPLGVYSEKIKIDELDELLAKLGQFSYNKWSNSSVEDGYEYTGNINYAASSEISPPSYTEWESVFNTYGIEAEDDVKEILFRINQTPRAFIKFSRLFYPETQIDMKMLREKALQYLPSVRLKERIGFYRFLLEFPSTDSIGNIESFFYRIKDKNRELSLANESEEKPNVLGELIADFKTIKGLHDTYEKEHSMLAKENRFEEANNLKYKLISNFPEDKRKKIQYLLDIYSTYKSTASRVMEVYEALTKEETLSKQRVSRDFYSYLSRLTKSTSSYYAGPLLFEPFKAVFQEKLCEVPSLEVLALEGRV